MTQKVSSGTCLLCRASVTKRSALKHGTACLQASDWPTGDEPSLLIMAQGRYQKKYWLVVLARHDARLGDLDQLIRDVWVECCGHLSAFRIGDDAYYSEPESYTDDMHIPLSHVVAPGSTFIYDYDFGSTTSLELKVIEEASIAPPEGSLCLIARNSRPRIPCDLCGDEAAFTLEDHDRDCLCYYCRECLSMIDHDPDDLEIISNSPRSGTCGYVEDPSAALRWYPPGWSADEIAPEGILEGLPNEIFPDDEEAEMDAAIAAVTQDARSEIDAFVEAEEAAYGEEIASMAGDTVMAFCIFMQLTYGAAIDAWDAPSVQGCLVKDLSQNPIYPDEWPENAVPILCRFMEHMEVSGRITNASELSVALREVEPAFQEAATCPEKTQALFKHILTEAEDAGVDTDDIDIFTDFAIRKFLDIVGLDLDDEEVQKELSDLRESGKLDILAGRLSATMILERCEDFCSQFFEDEAVFERCRTIAVNLYDHPDAPLMRGDSTLWSATIIYAVCQDMDLIRPGRGAPPLGQVISSFFGFERPSIRNKVRMMRSLLPD